MPGDCGEGVHFAGNVAYSTISDNFIANNSGGVLLSDDIGPTHDNVVENNVVTGNATDCGITVPGHNPGALSAKGVPQPAVAGVYRNVIRDNVVTDNGVKGEGAGVLFANAGPGTASYDNLVEGNYIAGNGLSGVTMHAHTIGKGQFEDLSGNVIVGNIIGKNNLDGDTLDSPARPEDQETTGVLVFSGGTRVTRHHRAQPHLRQLDRHLAQQAGQGVRPRDQHVHRRDHTGLREPLTRRDWTAGRERARRPVAPVALRASCCYQPAALLVLSGDALSAARQPARIHRPTQAGPHEHRGELGADDDPVQALATRDARQRTGQAARWHCGDDPVLGRPRWPPARPR